MVEDDKKLIIRFPDFAARVQQHCQTHGKSIRDIQAAVGVGYEMARRYFMGVSKPDDAGMEKLANLFKVTPAELDWGASAPVSEEMAIAVNDYKIGHTNDYLLRYYEDARLSAGPGVNNNGHKPPKMMPVPKWMLPADVDPTAIVIVPVKGTSMSGELEDGSLACVDTRDRSKFRSGKIYAFNQGDDTLVKYFYTRVGGGILIKAKNEAEWPEQVVAPYDLDKLDVVGRVIAGLNRYS